MMKTALLVDDNDDIRLLLQSTLSIAGFETIPASGGRHALDILTSVERLPDLIVLDVQMPDLDGWDTLDAIRANEVTSEIPVILCTVKGSFADVLMGWERGCDGYLSKPFNIDDLIAETNEVVARGTDERQAVRTAGLEEAKQNLDRIDSPENRYSEL